LSEDAYNKLVDLYSQDNIIAAVTLKQPL